MVITISQIGPKHRLHFACELRVNGISYVGTGNASNKKDAEKNAARDFINYLVQMGELNANYVPKGAIDQSNSMPSRTEPFQHETVSLFGVIEKKIILFFAHKTQTFC